MNRREESMALPDILHHHRKPLPVDSAPNFLADVRRNDIEQASHTLSKEVFRIPLLPYMGPSGGNSIVLKPENLQPRGSFKIRCSLNAIMTLSPAELPKGSTRRAQEILRWEWRMPLDIARCNCRLRPPIGEIQPPRG